MHDSEAVLAEAEASATNMKEHIRFLFEDVVRRGAKRIVEVGVCMGQSTAALLCAARETGGHLDSVDVTDYPETRAKVERWGLGEFWTYHVQRGVEYAKDRREPIDALLIDSSHEYEDTLAELTAFAPLLVPGGMIYVHDVLSENMVGTNVCKDNIQRALDEFFSDTDGQGWKVGIRKGSEGMAMLEKTKSNPAFSVVYYSHNQGPERVLAYCWENLKSVVHQLGGEIVAVTWKPMDGADTNIVVGEPKPGHVGIYEQILQGIEEADAEMVYLAEHDVLYPATHFRQPDTMEIARNANVWHLNEKGYFRPQGSMAFLSTFSGTRTLLPEAIQQKLAEAEAGTLEWAEPECETYHGAPILDIRHGQNLTGDRESETGKYLAALHPWGSARLLLAQLGMEYLSASVAVPGLDDDPRTRPDMALADCCGRMAARHGYVKVGGCWYHVLAAPAQKRDGEQDWISQLIGPVAFCEFCGTAFKDAPKRKYHWGAFPPWDKAIVESGRARA